MHYYQNLQKICKEKNITPTGLLKKMNIAHNKANAWKNGSCPKLDIAIMIAKELNEPLERFIDDNWQSPSVDSEKQELIDCFDKLDRSGKVQLLGKAYELVEGQSEKKDITTESKDSGDYAVVNETVSAGYSVKE